MDCGHADGMEEAEPGINTVIYHQLKQFNRSHSQSQLEENICAVSNTSLYCLLNYGNSLSLNSRSIEVGAGGNKTPAWGRIKNAVATQVGKINKG